MVSTYISPAKRQSIASTQSVQSVASKQSVSSTQKTIPHTFKRKTEFKLDDNLFPELGSGPVKPLKNVINFAAAAKHERIEIKEEIENLLKPGWVYIQRNQKNQIEYKFGEEVLSGDAEFYKYENKLDLCNLKSRIERLQWDCDCECENLGDLSPYHNKPTIKELLDNAYNIHSYNISDRTEITSSNESDNPVDE